MLFRVSFREVRLHAGLYSWSHSGVVVPHLLLTQLVCGLTVFCTDALVRLLVAVLPAAHLIPPHCPILLAAYQATLSTTGEWDFCSSQCLCTTGDCGVTSFTCRPGYPVHAKPV